MDAETERDWRELAARLAESKRHRRIGGVLVGLWQEIDALRARLARGSDEENRAA